MARLADKLDRAGRKPPKDRSVKMPGPHAPTPKTPVPRTLGDPDSGAYKIPGLGEWGKKRNVQEYERRRPYFGSDRRNTRRRA